jgi:diguanylate cyclase (GGDEF)-like protein
VLVAVTAAAAPSRTGIVSFRRVAIPENVPADMCTALAQDARGFLWIGTQSGVVRWDGQHFKVHPPPPGASYIRTLLATRDGRVWAGTFSGGIVVYDESGEVARYTSQLSHQRVEGLAEDREGTIWVATQEGLDRIDPKSRRVERVLQERMRGLLVDSKGRLWVGSRNGLQVRRGNAFVPVPGLEQDFVSKLFEDDRGRIWIGTADRGAAVLDPRTGAVTRIASLSHFWIYGIAQVGEELWLATFGAGIDVVDMNTLQVIDRLRNDPTLPNTIGGDRIGALLRDRSGVVWVGTWGQGLARHDPLTRAFRTIRHSPQRPEGLSHPAAVRAMEMSDGTVWVGTNGNGVDVLDASLRRVSNHPLGAITCLAEGPDGTRYVATLDGGLQRLRAGSTGFEKIGGLPGGPIRALTFGPDGELWAGAADGLARIDGDRVTVYRHDRENASTLSGFAVEAIAITGDGTMWVGTDNGLNVFDRRRGTAVRITEGLPNNWVPDLMVARDGRLWIATHAGACILKSWDGKRAAFERVAEKLKRAPAPVESLIEDEQGEVWLGPKLRVDPLDWTAEEFGPGDGCDFRSFYIASRDRMRDGSLLFGSPEGLLVVQPRELRRWTYAPAVVATSLRVDGVERAIGSELKLSPDARGFRLDFAALDLSAPERNRYRYRLEPFDANWIETDASRRSLAYTNLGAGDYTLRVQGTNRAGEWSPHELRLPVRVVPAFYETLWFRLLAALALCALAYGAYRLRVRQLGARARELERVVRERTAELEEAYARIESASLTDPLTGLRNRRYLEQVIGADQQLAERRGEDLVLLLVDLDHFKSVNDRHGHAAGDAVLVQTAEVLRQVFRASDHLVRWGGEEFLIVARFVDRAHGPELGEKLRAAVEAHPFALPAVDVEHGEVLRRTCSIGVAAWPSPPLSWDQVIQEADAALYEAKRGGRNAVRARETIDAGGHAFGVR